MKSFSKEKETFLSKSGKKFPAKLTEKERFILHNYNELPSGFNSKFSKPYKHRQGSNTISKKTLPEIEVENKLPIIQVLNFSNLENRR